RAAAAPAGAAGNARICLHPQAQLEAHHRGGACAHGGAGARVHRGCARDRRNLLAEEALMHSIIAARTDFSLGESILTTEILVEEAKRLGVSTVGVTDTMSITCMVDFTTRAKKAGLRPIVGCRLRL